MSNDQLADRAEAPEGEGYEILIKRFACQGTELSNAVETLNHRRLEEFGSRPAEILGRTQIRTRHDCLARDIVRVGEHLLFGYNVVPGLKSEPRVEQVFGLYRLHGTDEGFNATAVAIESSWLADSVFNKDFSELYTYYRDAQLLELAIQENRLFASFRIGERIDDVRVFCWSIGDDGVRYLDSRGKREIASAPAHDFEWHSVTREMIVSDPHLRISVLNSVCIRLEAGELVINVDDRPTAESVRYRHTLVEKTQSLQDLRVAYARLGDLIVLDIAPYKEDRSQYLVCNLLTRSITRTDAIGQACLQLPDGHGIIFPGGTHLQSGEHKVFDAPVQTMRFKRVFRSPNGEDILYIFQDAQTGRSALFTYNTIRRQLQPPVFCQGYARFDDGQLAICTVAHEPGRTHSLQIWQTPFFSEEHVARQAVNNSFLGRIGNPELIRGISDLHDLARAACAADKAASQLALSGTRVTSLFDKYSWLSHGESASMAAILRDIARTGESFAKELEKVEVLRDQAAQRTLEASHRHALLKARLQASAPQRIEDFVAHLEAISTLRGHLLTLRDERYVDVAAIDSLDTDLSVRSVRLTAEAADFLSRPEALLPYRQRIATLHHQIEKAASVLDLKPSVDDLAEIATGLDLLTGLAEAVAVEDTGRRTQLTEAISSIYALVNQATAFARSRRKALTASETVAQFSAQFHLFSQSIPHALGLASTLERCDTQLSKVLTQLEDMESRFGDHEPFLNDLMVKREELLEAFEQHRQGLVDVREAQAAALHSAALRILNTLPNRLITCSSTEQLQAFFVTDPQAVKLRNLAERLRAMDQSVKADDLDAQLKGIRYRSITRQRDRAELFDSSGKLLKLGPRYAFSVNTQPLDLTLVSRDGEMWLHITGTDFHQRLDDDVLAAGNPLVRIGIESESDALYRAEYLAWKVLEAASVQDLLAMEPGTLEQHIRAFCTPLYREGYEKGVHDHDAARIIEALAPGMLTAGLLRFGPEARALALMVWHVPGVFEAQVRGWPRQARSAYAMRRLFGHEAGLDSMRSSMASLMDDYATTNGLTFSAATRGESADYLLAVLAQDAIEFEISGHAWEIVSTLDQRLDGEGCHHELTDAVRALDGEVSAQWSLIRHWVIGACLGHESPSISRYGAEATVVLLLRFAGQAAMRVNHASLICQAQGLLGDHPMITDGVLETTIDGFFARAREHAEVYVPQFQAWQALRQSIIQRERETLRIAELRSPPLASFVRNRLIDQVYLPLIANSLAKQMGAAGQGRRTDLMGLLILISPPGYGKTTLIEYVAFQLGMAFVKVNGPALGHRVTSLDPAQAPDGPSRVELEKLNLALKMGSNVCLLIDDIQHLSAEFLQKFISLCDGTRRIEHTWRGQTRTCDLRGKKFCIVMAGNPYTESGQTFQIPGMLVNRADVYNLGDMTGGNSEAFALSYIENCMTSNPVLAPLASRDINDLYRLSKHAQGHALRSHDLSHDYSQPEITELIETLRRLFVVRDVLLKVNAAYIESAAQADSYRTEPPFRLQGSYRNMNKLAEKVSVVMNDSELDELITDHYRGEAQLLTGGAEENLLKLAELRGSLDTEQAVRWEQIKTAFVLGKVSGGAEIDVGNRLVAQLAQAVEGIQAIAAGCGAAAQRET